MLKHRLVSSYFPLSAINNSISCSLIPTIASPRSLDNSAIRLASVKFVTACTIAAAHLKIPDPTKTPSAPNCIIKAASAGVATPPAAKFTTGSFPFS